MRDLVRTLFVFGVFQVSQLVGPGHGEGFPGDMTKQPLEPSNLKKKKRDWRPLEGEDVGCVAMPSTFD